VGLFAVSCRLNVASRRLRAARTPKETRATDALAPTLAPIIMCALSAFLLVVLAGGGF
jgi:hypothetical protein